MKLAVAVALSLVIVAGCAWVLAVAEWRKL